MTDSNARLSYTLGALFTVVAVVSLIEFVYSAYNCLRTHTVRISFIYIFAIYAFTQIRMVYFFLIPSLDFTSSAVTDYILVVLPTFLYFTGFSTIVISWAVALSGTSSSKKSSVANHAVIAVMNILLYILFIIICVVFQYSEPSSPSICPGRQALKDNNHTQQVISVVYAAFISALSLGIAIAFVIFGNRIVRSFSTSQSSDVLKRTTKKIFNLSLLGSFAFILHCVFILVLTGGNLSIPAFSFVFLLVSEIIPAFLMVTIFTTQSGFVHIWEKLTGTQSALNTLSSTTSSATSTTSYGSSSSSSGSNSSSSSSSSASFSSSS